MSELNAGSLARMPNAIDIDGPTCAVAVCRAGSAPFSPVYQNTVLAGVPATSEVAVSNGGPLTRCGGFEVKKSFDAASAEAAGNAVCARLVTAPLSAVCKLAAVSAVVVPMVNWPGPGGELVVACSEMVWVEPSGKVRPNWIVSPSFGLAPSVTEIDGGEPLGPATVAPAIVVVAPASLKPNGEVSWLTEKLDPTTALMERRPVPPVPRSACCRSAMIWVKPACAPLPLRIVSVGSTDGVVLAVPENRYVSPTCVFKSPKIWSR